MANVLIVDDEEMDRRIGSQIVEDAGHTPFFAGDGEVALQMYKNNDIALVITDLQMPKVDGLRLIRELFEYDSEANVIVVSGHPELIEKAERYGAVTGLAKPIEPEKLMETVQAKLPSPARDSARDGDLWGSGEVG